MAKDGKLKVGLAGDPPVVKTAPATPGLPAAAELATELRSQREKLESELLKARADAKQIDDPDEREKATNAISAKRDQLHKLSSKIREQESK